MAQIRRMMFNKEFSNMERMQSERRFDQPTLFDEGAGLGPTEEDGQFLEKILAFDGDPPPIYLVSILLGSVLILAAASLGLFPWAGSALGVVGLLATVFRGGRWVTLVFGLGVIAVVVASSWPREPTLADLSTGGATVQSQASPADQVPEGSLGFRLSELADLWNALEQPPAITRGFSRSLEGGLLDGFVLRFDDGASLSGAYDPGDDYVYAISASTRLDHEAATTMYLHLCFVLHPYSQECIDSYWDEGLDGSEPIDYLGGEHTAEWRIGEETWRLGIVGNVQEIKVLGEPPG